MAGTVFPQPTWPRLLRRGVMGSAVVLTTLLGFPGWGIAQSELVIHKTGTKDYHRPGCPVISDGKNIVALTRAQAEGRGLKAHACEVPDASPPGQARKPALPTDVYADGGKHYHLEKCARLGKSPKKLALDEAGRKLWPCPACKPPIRKRPG